ncbi:MAG: DUF4261 domain-containing protein [bacterium]|nr:DUF4261 domain-containing protein [bacterium]
MGLFSKKKKQEETAEGATPVLSFVLYNEYTITEAQLLLNTYNKICDPKMKATNIESKDNTVTFEISGNMGFISFMPAPYPWEDLEGPCSTSWMWQEAKSDLQSHKNHIIVSWLSKNSEYNNILKSTIVSQLTASVAEEVNAIGVYWGNACLVNKKDVFCNMVYDSSEENLPYFLWIDFRMERHETGELNLITYGLESFDIMEIEIIKSKKEFEELIDFSLNIVQYLIANGNVIKDGDTLGEDENQKILASHTESVWSDDNRGLVLRIEY